MSVVVSTIIVFVVKPTSRQIPIIGYLPKGLNPPSSNMLYFDGSFFGLAIKTGIVSGVLALTEGIAVGKTFASLNNYQVDGNKEMMAIGLVNIAGSCSSCYTTGSFSRSAVNYNAGAQTALSNIVMAVFRLWKVDKLDFLACMSSFFGVLFVSVPLGLAISVGVSVFKILLHTAGLIKGGTVLNVAMSTFYSSSCSGNLHLYFSHEFVFKIGGVGMLFFRMSNCLEWVTRGRRILLLQPRCQEDVMCGFG